MQLSLVLSSLLAGLDSGSKYAMVEKEWEYLVTSFHNSYLEFLFPSYYTGSRIQKRNGELRVWRGSFLFKSAVTYIGDISHGMLLWALMVNDCSFQIETPQVTISSVQSGGSEYWHIPMWAHLPWFSDMRPQSKF